MDPSQRCSILLAEYNTLRTEVLAARSNISQAISVTATVAMALVGLMYYRNGELPPVSAWLISSIATTYLCGTILWNEINTRKFTQHLRALEDNINGWAGERLLTWENDHGWGSIVVRMHSPTQDNTAPDLAPVAQQSVPGDAPAKREHP